MVTSKQRPEIDGITMIDEICIKLCIGIKPEELQKAFSDLQTSTKNTFAANVDKVKKLERKKRLFKTPSISFKISMIKLTNAIKEVYMPLMSDFTLDYY